jgi:hypothetical protein
MPAMSTVTLETKCWNDDWRRILKTDRLRTLAERNRFEFADRTLMINNVDDVANVTRAAERAVAGGLLTRHLLVADYAEEALRFFDLTAAALTKGYVYSIAELVSIYLCDTDYLLHFAGDCLPMATYDWVANAVAVMETDARIKVANLAWDGKYDEAAAESSFQIEDFFIGFGFSDQCYLVRTADFRAPIYNESHADSARYPEYGGELFEKRVDSWMRNHGYLRATFKHGSYLHEPWTRQQSLGIRGQLGRLRRQFGNHLMTRRPAVK